MLQCCFTIDSNFVPPGGTSASSLLESWLSWSSVDRRRESAVKNHSHSLIPPGVLVFHTQCIVACDTFCTIPEWNAEAHFSNSFFVLVLFPESRVVY